MRTSLSIILLLLFNYSFGQKVFEVKHESQANVKVFPVKYQSQADLLVYWVKYESQAKEDGLWFAE